MAAKEVTRKKPIGYEGIVQMDLVKGSYNQKHKDFFIRKMNLKINLTNNKFISGSQIWHAFFKHRSMR